MDNEILEALAEAREELQGNQGDEITDAMKFMEAELDNQQLILPRGLSVPCVPSMVEFGSEVVVGGALERIRAAVKVRCSHFVETGIDWLETGMSIILTGHDAKDPRSGEVMQFRGARYRLLTVGMDGTKSFYVLTFGSAK